MSSPDLKPLAGLTELKELVLYDNQITDLKPLAGLTELTTLNLSDNQITDLTPLAGLTELKELLLFSNQITKAEIAKLQKALPKCRIKHDATK